MQELEVIHRSATLFVGDFRCRVPTRAAGSEEASDAHEIVLLRSGLFVKEVGRQRVVADPNHVLFFNRDEPYRVSHPLPGGDDCLVLVLATQDLLDVLGEHESRVRDRPEAPFACTHAPSTPRAFLLQRRLLALWKQNALTTLALEELVFDLAEEVIAAAFSTRPWRAEPRRSETLRAHRETVGAVQILLAQRFGESLTLHEIARAVHCGPFHLARLFRREVGLPIHRYLNRLRLRAALERITEGEQDLTKLALDLGFADHSHFTNAFRREFAMPPSALRHTMASRCLVNFARIFKPETTRRC